MVLENWTSLTLTLTDGDDQVPVFAQPVYQFTVPEDHSQADLPATWAQVWAYDQDSGINATILYTLPGRVILLPQT